MTGELMRTRLAMAYSNRSRSCSNAAERDASSGTNITTISGARSNWSQYAFLPRSFTLPRIALACCASLAARAASSRVSIASR